MLFHADKRGYGVLAAPTLWKANVWWVRAAGWAALLFAVMAACLWWAPGDAFANLDATDAATSPPSTASAHARPRPARGTVMILTPESLDSIDSQWNQVRRKLNLSGMADLDVHLERIGEIARDNGVRNLPHHSSALLVRAGRALNDRMPLEAERLGLAAAMLSPDMSQPQLFLARVYLLHSFQPVEGVLALYRGLSRKTSYSPHLILALGEALFVLTMAGALTLLLVVVLLWCRHGRQLGHDLWHGLPEWFSQGQAAVLPLLGLAGLLVVGFGVLFVALAASALLWRYLAKKERKVVAFFAVLVLLAQPVVGFVDSVVQFPGSIDEALLRVAYESGTPGLTQKLRHYLDRHPYDVDVTGALAVMYKRRGRTGEAEELARSAMEADPREIRHVVNLGAIVAAQGKVEEARSLLNGALAMEYDHVAARFNSGRVWEMMLEERSVEDFRIASQRDEKRVDALRQANSQVINMVFMDEPPTGWIVLRRLLAGSPEQMRLVQALPLWIRGGLPVPLGLSAVAVFVGTLVGLASLVGLLFRRLSIPVLCCRCGTATCMGCGETEAKFRHCPECYPVFHGGRLVNPRIRHRVTYEAGQRITRLRVVHVLLTLFTAGGGHILAGRVVKGALLSCAFFAFGMALWFQWGMIRGSHLVLLVPWLRQGIFLLAFLATLAAGWFSRGPYMEHG